MFVDTLAPIGRSIDAMRAQARTAEALEERNAKAEIKHLETIAHRKEMERIANERLDLQKQNAQDRAEREKDRNALRREELETKRQNARDRINISQYNAETKRAHEFTQQYKAETARDKAAMNAFTNQYKAETQRMAEERRGRQ